MAIQSNKDVDLEAGNNNQQLYPNMTENPQMRWSFIRKVYAILCLQLILTFGIGLAMFLVHPVREFMRTKNGLIVMIVVIILAFILVILMRIFSKVHPLNYVIMVLFTIAMGGMIGAVCTQEKGQAVLVAAGLTILITVSLTLFTFFAAKRGVDFNFLGPFLLCALIILIGFGILRIVFPMGKILEHVFACIGALVFSGFIIYDTDNLIKRYSYDEYIDAAASLYLDVINLFLQLLQLGDFSD